MSFRHSVLGPIAASLAVAACSAAPPAGVDTTDTTSEASKASRHARWTALATPEVSWIVGGPWTLGQSGASSAAPSAGYCVAGAQQPNTGAQVMRPYYQPFTLGTGPSLRGYFDYRPKDDDEAIVAATSDDHGRTWTFEQQVLELTTACPTSDDTTLGNDDGLGHPAVLLVDGQPLLYALDRTPATIDSAGLAVYPLAPSTDAPLAPAPRAFSVATRTTGLLDPDGIVGALPGVVPTTVMYLQKSLGGDRAFPAEQQCPGSGANHDVTRLRLAMTLDGVHFDDLGEIEGINDPTDVSPTGTRYVGPRGTVLLLSNGRFGFFFSGGNCLDADSDAFHYMGYAESTDLLHWRVVHGMNAPVASIAPVTVAIDGRSITIPETAPVVGDAPDWFAGRVYGPSATRVSDRTVSVVFSGYHTKKPKDDMGNYRTVGQVFLSSSVEIVAGSED